MSSEVVVLDEVILQIFEEEDEAFHFPVTSQKDARAFVKALHKKGLSYDSLSHEIKELEQNFSAWRTGISRSGIGNRIIERINRPLQEVLLSDGEEDSDCCDQLSDSCAEVKDSTEADPNGFDCLEIEKSDFATAVKSNSQQIVSRDNCQQLNVDGNKIHREYSDDSNNLRTKAVTKKESKEKITEDLKAEGKQENITETSEIKKDLSVAESVTNSYSDKNNFEEEKMQTETQLALEEDTKKENDHRSPKIDEGESNKKTDAEKSDISEKSNEVKEILEGEGEKDVDCDIQNISSEISKNGHVDVTHSQSNNLAEEKLLQENSCPTITILGEKSTGDAEKFSAAIEVRQKYNDELAQIEVVNAGHESVDVTEEKVKSADLDFSFSSLQENNSENKADDSTICLSSPEKHEEVESNQHIDKCSVSKSSAIEHKENIVETAVSELQSASCSLPCAATNVDNNVYDDILESYDSDRDDELSHDVTSTTDKLPTAKDSHKAISSSGYVYVFTDSSSKVAEFRVKIGASRFPHKKLKQALHFNIDLKLVSAILVSNRQKALTEVHQQLSELAIPSSVGWYCGSLDRVLNVLMAAAKQYPAQD